MLRKLFLFLLMLSTLLMSGCVMEPLDPAVGVSPFDTVTALSPDENSDSKLKPQDPLYIRFSGIMDQQAPLEATIDETGDINLLHLKEPVKAAGLTPSELANKIERLYIDGNIYKNVSVNVTMTAKLYYVQGEVMQPGQFQLMSGTTLLQAIAGARGFTPYADKKKIDLIRGGQTYRYNYKELEKDPSKDVKIKAGDVIKVRQSWY